MMANSRSTLNARVLLILIGFSSAYASKFTRRIPWVSSAERIRDQKLGSSIHGRCGSKTISCDNLMDVRGGSFSPPNDINDLEEDQYYSPQNENDYHFGAEQGGFGNEYEYTDERSSMSSYTNDPHGEMQYTSQSQPMLDSSYDPYHGRSQQTSDMNHHHHMMSNEPDFPPPSLPGDDEPPLPTDPYGTSYPNGAHGRHMPPPRNQRYATQSPPPPQQNYQQQSTQAPLNDGLELESFDKDLIFQGLKRMYRKKILPLEIGSKYGHFHSPPLSPSDFDAKPMVLLLGQYSVGKTSFIRYLLGRDFPGIRVGPEPTTDRFTCILHGETDKIVPGAALCSQADRPFRGLSPFGNNFLSKLEAVEMDAPILRNITLVDTPGILSGVKQSQGRNYDYDAVMKWFAERADLIIIMFDAHKLDISDELKRVIEMMKPHSDKVRVVLNKADSVSTQQLMRVYGALMWSLGKVMNTPEVCRVYIGSFWAHALKNTEQAALLNREKLDLFSDIAQLPQNAVMRRINELVKRARGVKVHAYIIHYLRKQLPYTFGKREKQAKLIQNLDRELVMCARRYELPRGDFPEVEPLRQALREIKDLSEFPKLDKKMVTEMDKVFSVDIPDLLQKARGG